MSNSQWHHDQVVGEKAMREHEENTRDWMEKREDLLAALRVLSKDMHVASSRPCTTCKAMTRVLGEPFGCYELQERYNRGNSK